MIVRALAIWPFTAIIFAGLVFAGYVHGPWNGCWFFAMGCWFVLDTFWVLAAQTTKPIVPARQYRRAALTSAVVHLLYCLPLSSVPVLGLQILPRSILPEAAGAALCVVGVGFAIWSRYVLAGNWNAAVPLQQRHQLVRSGPYAIVRHPIYLGFFLVVCGMILALGEVRALVCAIHATQFFHKMKLEENILRETYPGEYPEYERKVKRLLPCIW
ncbi:MAG TPA: isoprenylcysteine carboxylmethyltransferase family protein [Verrucomicrobiae bacterium]|nr:isoprenylcysteine carboxylmethyltransferase family protein [Verrucomicrobiae bacterium]